MGSDRGPRGRNQGERGNSRPPSRLNSGRLAAGRALVLVEEGEHLQEALIDSLGRGEERQLAWFIALGVQRHRASIDAALRPHLSKPLTSLDVEVRTALRVGTFEKLYARTSDHAAVDQAVELSKALGLGRAKSMVNAVLRRVAPNQELTLFETLEHPEWIVNRWVSRYGQEAAENWCRSNNALPPITLIARDDAAFKRISGQIEGQIGVFSGKEVPRTWRVEGGAGRVEALPGFENGDFWVADLASVAVADMVPTGGSVLDATAAPGGKTMRLLSQGVNVCAVDASAKRLTKLHDSLRRIGFEAHTVVHDWLSEAPPKLDIPLYSVALVDAPCSALGTLGRHPDVRWRRRPTDLAQMAQRQIQILDRVAESVEPGGVIVYSVCSAEPEEGEQVVAQFVASHSGAVLDTSWTSAPPTDGEDGFFAARITLP
jgi:16S rRNA (cytosine967-C5)-methyltransferase